MLYPDDAITIPFVATGSSTITLLEATSSPRTILNVQLQSASDSFLIARCQKTPSEIIGYIYGKMYTNDRQMLYACNEKIDVQNTNTIVGHGQIVYVNRGFASSSFQTFKSGFTYGEILQITALFTLALIVSYAFVHFWIRGVRIKK